MGKLLPTWPSCLCRVQLYEADEKCNFILHVFLSYFQEGVIQLKSLISPLLLYDKT